MAERTCSRVGCPAKADHTLTYDYGESLMVVGPLSFVRDPHSYDLCARHARSLSAPVGWEIMRYVKDVDVHSSV